MLCICRYDLQVDSEKVTCQMIPSALQHLLFSVFYRPPNTEKAFLESVNSFLDAVSNTDDFNLPCVDLSTGSATVADNLTKSFCEILYDHFLTQTNHYITRFKNTGSAVSSGNILDLVLTNNDALFVEFILTLLIPIIFLSVSQSRVNSRDPIITVQENSTVIKKLTLMA